VARSIAEGYDITVVPSAANDAVYACKTPLDRAWDAVDGFYRQQLEQPVDELVSQCVAIVDARHAPQAAFSHLPEVAPHVNAIIAAVAGVPPNVVVVPRCDLSRQHDECFGQGGLHFGDVHNGEADFPVVGAQAFSTAISTGVQQCGTKLHPVGPSRFTPLETPVRILGSRPVPLRVGLLGERVGASLRT
jgi:hypothetical protein